MKKYFERCKKLSLIKQETYWIIIFCLKLQTELNKLRNENQEAEATIQNNHDQILKLNDKLKNSEELLLE